MDERVEEVLKLLQESPLGTFLHTEHGIPMVKVPQGWIAINGRSRDYNDRFLSESIVMYEISGEESKAWSLA